MYDKEMFKYGVYGVMDLDINHIVYVGSTNVSFVARWGYHSRDVLTNRHHNKQLTELLKNGNFEFIILESGEFTSKELLDRERYYTDKFGVAENGYCLHVGGGKLKEAFQHNTNFAETKEVINARKYIMDNWYDKKIYKEDKISIEQYLDVLGIDIVRKQFMGLLKRLGFTIQRYADKKSWQITGITF